MSTQQSAQRRRVRGRPMLLGVLGILVLAAAGLTCYLALRPVPENVEAKVADDGTYQVGSLPTSAERDVVAAAVRAIPEVLSYDYRELGESQGRARAHSTPEFADDYDKAFRSTVAAMAGQKRAVTKALVRGAGVVHLTGDHATCLVFVDQLLVPSGAPEAAPAGGPGPDPTTRVAQSRVVVAMTRRDGTWLISGLTPM